MAQKFDKKAQQIFKSIQDMSLTVGPVVTEGDLLAAFNNLHAQRGRGRATEEAIMLAALAARMACEEVVNDPDSEDDIEKYARLVKTRTVDGARQFLVLIQNWIESERGWGQRDDGWTLHLDSESLKEFTRRVYGDRTGPAPEVYTRAEGPSFFGWVSEKHFKELVQHRDKHGAWGDTSGRFKGERAAGE